MLYHYNENYVVNEYGECFSLMYGKLRKLKPRIGTRGYAEYRLRIDGKTVTKSAHYLSYWVNMLTVSFRGIKIVITKTHLVTRKRLQKIKHRLAHSQCC